MDMMHHQEVKTHKHMHKINENERKKKGIVSVNIYHKN